MTTEVTSNRRTSPKLFIVLGVLWLSLAAVHLIYQLANPTVEVRWETATEVNTAGFNLYRSEARDGDFMQINAADGLIASQGEAVSGAAYTYMDKTVEAGKTYYYVLEEVEYNAATRRYEEDLFTYKVPFITWWTVVLTAVSVLVGFALLVAGLKEERSL
ncbi:MAG: hypothetical protein IAE79_12250 [Anaerolinea sp.]|nr:hypothetical protein [Anaerolinea sp.]